MYQVGIRNFTSDNTLTFANCTKLSGGFRKDLLQRVDYNINEPTTSFVGFFEKCKAITNNFECELPTTIKDISCFCSECTNLTRVSENLFPLFYIFNLINVSEMFKACTALTDFPPSANNLWNLPEIQNVRFISNQAFANCPVSSCIPTEIQDNWI